MFKYKRKLAFFVLGSCIVIAISLLAIFSLFGQKEAKADQPETSITNEKSFQNNSYQIISESDDQDYSLREPSDYLDLTLQRNPDGKYQQKTEYVSPDISYEHPVNIAALKWTEKDLPDGTKIEVAIRAKNDKGEWDPTWFTTEAEEADVKDGALNSNQRFTPPFIFNGVPTEFQYKVILSSSYPDATPVVSDFELVLIDSSQGPQPATAFSSSAFNPADLPPQQPAIYSRAQWGANESLMTWNPEYVETQKIILHHTAGCSNPTDPAATIRGIYYYHAITLGWGDIGYNFLVDQWGNIYEGRYGGDNVVGGHAYGYNYGSTGSTFLGYTHPTGYPSYCNGGPTGLPSSSKQAFINLAAWKGIDHNIDPLGSGWFVNKNLPNIAGHRDANSTSCPGDYFYSQIPTIRSETRARIDELLPLLTPTAAPSGSFIKGTGVTVYRIEGGLKRPISSQQVFNSWTTWGEVTDLTDEELDTYPDGPALPFADNALIKVADQPTVYWIQDGFKRPIASGAALSALGYTMGDVTNISASNLNLNTTGGTVDTNIASELPSGTFVKVPDKAAVFKIEGGLKRRFTTASSFLTHTSWSKINPVSQSTLDQYAEGPVMKIASGSLVKGSGPTFYYVENEYLRGFSSYQAYSYFGFRGGELRQVQDSDLSLNEFGDAIDYGRNKSLAQTFVKSSAPTVYFLDGKKRGVPSQEVLSSYTSWSRVLGTSSYVLNEIAAGSNLVYSDGSLVKGTNAAVYFVENEKRRRFTSGDSFYNKGFSFSRVQQISNTELNWIPEGLPIY